MNSSDLAEAIAIMNDVLSALQGTVVGQTPIAGAKLKFLCGQLIANGPEELYNGDTQPQFWIDFSNCFEATPPAGATFAGMETVRATAIASQPLSLAGIAVKNFSIRMSLLEEARILAATNFTSRQQIDNYFNVLNVSFNSAIVTAADNLDNVAYVLLINLFGAVSNDLATRSRPLPSMNTHNYVRRRASLSLAQLLYQDTTRNDQLIAENSPIHPLFMPTTIVALSS